MASSIRRAIIQLRFFAEYLGGKPGLEQKISDEQRTQFTNGTGSGQFNKPYTTTLTIAAGSNTTLTLSSLTNDIGESLSLTKLNGLLIRHLPTSLASQVTVGGGTTPVFGTKLVGLEFAKGDAMGFECLAGYTIASASNDKIKFINSDGSNAATVTVTVFGSQ